MTATAVVAQRRVSMLLQRSLVINSVGDGCFYVLSALYFTGVAGLSPTQLGTGLTVAWGAGFLASAPLGRLADVIGLRRAAMIFASGAAAALFVLDTVGVMMQWTSKIKC